MGEHVFVEHTGEVRLELRGATEADILAEATLSLAELMLSEGTHPTALSHRRPVEVRSSDRAALLVDWLNEILFLSDLHKEVYTQVQLEHATDQAAHGWVRGISPEAIKTAVKAATLHEVVFQPDERGWRAGVVLDV